MAISFGDGRSAPARHARSDRHAERPDRLVCRPIRLEASIHLRMEAIPLGRQSAACCWGSRSQLPLIVPQHSFDRAPCDERRDIMLAQTGTPAGCVSNDERTSRRHRVDGRLQARPFALTRSPSLNLNRAPSIASPWPVPGCQQPAPHVGVGAPTACSGGTAPQRSARVCDGLSWRVLQMTSSHPTFLRFGGPPFKNEGGAASRIASKQPLLLPNNLI